MHTLSSTKCSASFVIDVVVFAALALSSPVRFANTQPFPLPSFKLKSLDPDTEYIMHVHAHTSAGMGVHAWLEGRTRPFTRQSAIIVLKRI